MEKKNTILLTVIAIATLLVAVVGATFAYFTATVENDPTGTHTDTMTAKTLVKASMKLGDTISAEDGILPGFEAVRSINIQGSDGDTAVNTQIELTPNVPENTFGTDMKYHIYKVDSKTSTTAVACKDPVVTTSSEGTTPVQHFMTTECGSYTPAEGTTVQNATFNPLPTTLNTEDANKVTLVKEGNFSGTTKVIVPDIEVANGTNVTYYVLVEYYNNPSAAQTGQGATFTVQMDLVEASKPATTP